MPKQNIEKFLGLSEEEIERRSGEFVRKIPTKPGIGFLQTKLKQFEVQPWPLIIYLAHYNPDLLSEAIHKYKNYDGEENIGAIMEGLRDYYIMGKLLGIGIKAMEAEKDRNS